MDDQEELEELIDAFLTESQEEVETLETRILGLEDEAEASLVDSIFRAFHTIKGTAGCFEFKNLESLTHVAETVLDLVRSDRLEISDELISVLLSVNDALKALLWTIADQGNDQGREFPELVATLKAIADKVKGEAARPSSGEPAPEDLARKDDGDCDGNGPEDAAAASAPAAPEAAATTVIEAASAPTPAVEAASASTTAVEAAAPSTPAAAPSTPKPKPNKEKATAPERVSIRVGIETLDRLMNLVGELVLARNQIVQSDTLALDPSLRATAQQLSHITGELQESVMDTRMQPMETIWNGLYRVVRDLSRSLGKEILLDLEGKETEVDKTIIESIKDPLTHIIRNAVDHGIELPEAREAVGKDRAGMISLRAFHEGGRVHIEIQDDGGGIDPDKMRSIAIEKGVISSAQAAELSDAASRALIFAPGFSTAAEVTNISGRGVGMDVVRSNIEGIGGQVEIQSEIGEGTTFQIKIPLTLAIIPALMVSSGGERFAIPQANLMELVRVGEHAKDRAIEQVRGAPVLRLRDRLLPLVRLRQALGHEEAISEVGGPVAVLQANGRRFGLVVDEIRDTFDIVVKPLGTQLKNSSLFSGATILGDGSVSLIIDVVGLSQKAHMPTNNVDGIAGGGFEGMGKRRDKEAVMMVVFSLGDDRRLAAPLEIVHRLEMVAPERLERTGHGIVVQYQDEIVPVLALADDPRPRHEDPSCQGEIPLLLREEQGSLIGVAVSEVIDIVSVELPRAQEERPPSLVIDGRVTELSNLEIKGGVFA